MAKIKILHVVNSLDPGGMENGVVNIIRALSADFDFQVACLERRGRFAERLANPQTAWELGKKNGFTPQTAARLAIKILQLRPDVIHTHNLGPLIYSSLATCGGIVRPILHGEHSQLTPEECSPRRLRQRRFFYRFCRSIHTVSQSQKHELVSKGFHGIDAIVNGVDVDRFAPGSKQEAILHLGIPADSMVMGVVGRFGPFKRHSVLLEAFAGLANLFPNLHLLVVGAGGPQETAVRQQAADLECSSRIHFTGFQNEPARFYRAMDFLIVPSINEGLSNAVLEAMACGIPVLAHLACGNEEVIASGREGLVTDLGSCDKLRSAVEAILGKREQFALWSRNARAKAVGEFSLNRMVNRYASVYRSIALGQAN